MSPSEDPAGRVEAGLPGGTRRRARLWWRAGAMIVLAVAGGVGAQWSYQWALRPAPTPWVRLHPGVDYRCWELKGPGGAGRAMALRLDLRTPGVALEHRAFRPDPETGSPLFTLVGADWALRREDCLALVNSVRYLPGHSWMSVPGMPALPLETVVVEGEISHYHDHSYLVWWSREGRVGLEAAKPPPDPLPERVGTGVGIQGVQVENGRPNYGALEDLPLEYPRTFIGVEPESGRVWLMAWEKVSGRRMIDEAVAAGVSHGGQLDSGDATHFILGRTGEGGPRAFSGIRNLRPLAGYLVVRVEAPH